MRKAFLFIITIVFAVNAFAQKNIIYEVDACVADSLKSGVLKIARDYRKPLKKLRLAVLVREEYGNFSFTLQEFHRCRQVLIWI